MIRPDFREFQSYPSLYSQNELLHYGMPRRSGRYPYGSGDRPFQSTGGQKRGIRGAIQRRKDKKNTKAAELLEREAEKQEKIKRAYEGKREEILKKGSAADIWRLHEKVTLTNQEIQQALDRINLETKLRQSVIAEENMSFEKMDRLVRKANKVTDWSAVGMRMWDHMAAVYNATESGQKDPWPYIVGKPQHISGGGGSSDGGSGGGGKKKKK